MQLLLRPRFGLGQSGETDFESGGLPGGTEEYSFEGSGEGAEAELPVDPSTLYAPPGYNQQASVDPVTGRPFNSAQLARSLAAGTVVLTSALTGSAAAAAAAKGCGKYATHQGQCVSVPGGASIIPGVSNQTLMLIGIGLFALIMIGGRKR